ncbi:Protein phosphatase PP2A regulatory subunit B [Histomonas meleagridis]|nr:Protein phosphatase PP2A regulatory subunit B [Histomonas meleagridis]
MLLFEKSSNGEWNKTLQWIGSNDEVDPALQKQINGCILDTDFFQYQGKPILACCSSRKIGIWLISEQPKPILNSPYNPNGLEFPSFSIPEKCVLTAKEVEHFQPISDSYFNSICICRDNLTLCYSEGNDVFIRRIDNFDPHLNVYTNDSLITRVDFHPTQYDLLLSGDESGFCNIIDLRIQPKQNKPNFRADVTKNIGNDLTFINECKFSPDGTYFFTRSFFDLLFWDVRNTSEPFSHIPISSSKGFKMNKINKSGKEFFRSSWINDESIGTGFYNGKLYIAKKTGEVEKFKVGKESRKNIFRSPAKESVDKKGKCVSAIDIVPGTKTLAVACGNEVIVYDFL